MHIGFEIVDHVTRKDPRKIPKAFCKIVNINTMKTDRVIYSVYIYYSKESYLNGETFLDKIEIERESVADSYDIIMDECLADLLTVPKYKDSVKVNKSDLK